MQNNNTEVLIDIKKLTNTLGNRSLAELQQHIAALMELNKASEIESAKAQILAIAATVGMSPAEIMAGYSSKPAKAPKERVAVPVKYRSTLNPNLEWTGRGRQPGWIKHHIEVNGGKLDDLRI